MSAQSKEHTHQYWNGLGAFSESLVTKCALIHNSLEGGPYRQWFFDGQCCPASSVDCKTARDRIAFQLRDSDEPFQKAQLPDTKETEHRTPVHATVNTANSAC